MPAIQRYKSGLIERDEFSADSSSNYLVVGGDDKYFTITGGIVRTYGQPMWAVLKGSLGTLCVTSKVKAISDVATTALMLMANADPTADTDKDGHMVRVSVYANQWQCYRMDGNTATSLGTTAATGIAAGDTCYYRVYRDGGNVVFRGGEGNLAQLNTSVADSNYTSNLYGGFRQNTPALYPTDNDYFETRTSHIVTCTNLPAGWKFKISDGTTTAQATESGGTATVDAGAILFPLANVQVLNDSDEVIETYTSLSDMGGGDTFQYAQTKTITITSDVYTKATNTKLFTANLIIGNTGLQRSYPLLSEYRTYPALLRKYPI